MGKLRVLEEGMWSCNELATITWEVLGAQNRQTKRKFGIGKKYIRYMFLQDIRMTLSHEILPQMEIDGITKDIQGKNK